MPTLYRAQDGSWHRRQIQAGPGYETHEIGTDKGSLQDFLNQHFGSGVAATPAIDERTHEDVPAAPVRKVEHCPKCKFEQTTAAAYVEARKRTLNTEAMTAWIDETDDFALSSVAGAVANRLLELAREAKGTGR